MTVEQISSYAGGLIALLVAYVPGVEQWYSAKDAKSKAGIMALLIAVIAGVIYGLSCAGLGSDLGVSVTCDQAGAWTLLKIFISALVANQSAFMIGVRPFKK